MRCDSEFNFWCKYKFIWGFSCLYYSPGYKTTKGTVVYYFELFLKVIQYWMLFSLGFLLRMCGFLNMVIETNWLKTVSEREPACLYTSKSLQTSVVTAVDFFWFMLTFFFFLLVLIRFIIMLILNIWVTATILHYRKTKKTD